jgi:conjugal transfer ATP-binding protein TraC
MKDLVSQYFAEVKEDYLDLYKAQKSKLKQTRAISDSEEPSLLDFLPYISFDAKYNVFENKTTQGVILRASHFTGINERTKNSLKNILSNDIPAGVTCQIINYASPRVGNLLDYWYSPDSQDLAYSSRNGICSKGDIYQKITKNRLDFFKKGSWQSLLGTKQNLFVRDFELYFCFSMAKNITESGKQDNLYTLKALQEKMLEALKGIGSDSYILNDKEFASFLQEILVPSQSLYKQAIHERVPHINDYFKSDCQIQMAKDRVKVKSSSLQEYDSATRDYTNSVPQAVVSASLGSITQANNFEYLVFEVTNFPETWDLESSIDYIGQFDGGMSLPCPFYISYGFVLKQKEESERSASKHRMIKTQQGDSKLPMFFPKMLEEINDWRYVSESINQGERLGKVVMYIVLLCKDEMTSHKSEAFLKDHFARLKFGIEKVNYDTLNSFLTTLPFNIAENWQMLDQLKVPMTVLSGAVMNLMPVFSDIQNYQNPLMLFVARRGQVFFFDNFKTADNVNGNFNMVIVGNSGRGKSVWLQEYTTAILRTSGQVIIIDDGRSFKNTCELLGGDFVDFGGRTDFCINPFSLYREQKGLEDQKEYKEYFTEPFIDLVVSILCIIINIDKNNSTDPEIGKYRTVLENAVAEVIEKKGNDGGFSDIRQELLNNKKIRSIQTESVCDNIEYVLRKYSDDGRYAKYFNGKSTLNITNDFTVFELSDLQHNLTLQNAVLMTVVFLVYAKMQGRTRRTALIIDEFWRLGAHPALKGPIEGFARRGRKYNLSLILASQCISDFANQTSEAGAAALAQSDWRIMLSVDGKDEQMLRTELKMTSPEITIASELCGLKGAYSEFMIRHKNNS